MSKQDYQDKLNRYIKQDKDGEYYIDKSQVEVDKGDNLLDDEESTTPQESLGFGIKINKERYTTFPDRLPTDGVLPRPPDEHSRMGLYESKRDLYLLIANAYNKIMERIENLENNP